MTKFNTASRGTKTVNAAGGEAFAQSPELELISLLLTSFAGEQTYRSESDTFQRLKELIAVCDKKFVAQAAIYARTIFGMRSITHVLASELAKHISGVEWAKDFYKAIVYRPDDMMEILSYHSSVNGKIPNSMKKGLAKAFDKFDKYSLAKYRGEGKAFKLVDVVNMVHPIPVEKNAEAIKELVSGNLKSFDTWESELSKAGQTAANEEELGSLKKEAWIKLIRENKLGYFALLRNLRNILEQAPEIIDDVCVALENEVAIKKSLVFPFRFLTAFEEIQKINGGEKVRQVLISLGKAVDISLANVPKFEGKTLVVLDISGSMDESRSMGQKSPHIIGALFSAVLLKSNNADFIMFSDIAAYHNINPLDSTIGIANSLRFATGGTNFHAIFNTANRRYDRIVILSDMQGWVGYNNPSQSFNEYKKRTGADPFVYSFDLKNYGSMMFPERNVFALAGFSDKVFDTMKYMEQDKNTLVNAVKSIVFN